MQLSRAESGFETPSATWAHGCSHYLLFVLQGFVQLALEPGGEVTLLPGDAVYLSEGSEVRFNAVSDGFECLELSAPAL